MGTRPADRVDAPPGRHAPAPLLRLDTEASETAVARWVAHVLPATEPHDADGPPAGRGPRRQDVAGEPSLRNLAVTRLRLDGATNLAAALRHDAADGAELIDKLRRLKNWPTLDAWSKRDAAGDERRFAVRSTVREEPDTRGRIGAGSLRFPHGEGRGMTDETRDVTDTSASPQGEDSAVLRARLEECARLLREADHIDADAQRIVADLVSEFVELHVPTVARAGAAHVAESSATLIAALHHQEEAGLITGARRRLEQVAARAEAEAPVATGLARRLIDALSGIGV